MFYPSQYKGGEKLEKNSTLMNGVFESIQEYNSSFLRTKIKMLAFGHNRNGSSFQSEESFFNATKTSLPLIPVVAKFNKEKDNLEGHNVTVEINEDGDYEFNYDTYPIGVVANNYNLTIEDVNEGTEEYPDIKKYVVIDNVFLWKRYKAVQKIESWIQEGAKPKVSVEIDNVAGSFDEDGYFKIDNFNFQAICALGSDIEPCFPRAEISTYSLSDLNKEFKDLIYELNQDLNKGGHANVAEKQDNISVGSKEDYADGLISNNDKIKLDSQENDNVTNATETPENTLTGEENSTPEDVIDSTQEVAEENNTPEIEAFTGEESPVVTVEDNTELEEAKAQVAEFTSKVEALESELTSLREYKRNREELDLRAKFDGQVSEDEFSQLFTDNTGESIESIETKVYALIGKKNFSIVKPKQTEQVNKAPIVSPVETQMSPYGDIFN